MGTNAEHINRENAKAELLALLNGKPTKDQMRAGVQRVYDILAGRSQVR